MMWKRELLKENNNDLLRKLLFELAKCHLPRTLCAICAKCMKNHTL